MESLSLSSFAVIHSEHESTGSWGETSRPRPAIYLIEEHVKAREKLTVGCESTPWKANHGVRACSVTTACLSSTQVQRYERFSPARPSEGGQTG